MQGWEQIVTVRNVDPFDINDGMDPGDGATEMVLIEVLVRYQGPFDPAPQDMTRVSWISPPKEATVRAISMYVPRSKMAWHCIETCPDMW